MALEAPRPRRLGARRAEDGEEVVVTVAGEARATLDRQKHVLELHHLRGGQVAPLAQARPEEGVRPLPLRAVHLLEHDSAPLEHLAGDEVPAETLLGFEPEGGPAPLLRRQRGEQGLGGGRHLRDVPSLIQSRPDRGHRRGERARDQGDSPPSLLRRPCAHRLFLPRLSAALHRVRDGAPRIRHRHPARRAPARSHARPRRSLSRRPHDARRGDGSQPPEDKAPSARPSGTALPGRRGPGGRAVARAQGPSRGGAARLRLRAPPVGRLPPLRPRRASESGPSP